MSVAPHHHWGEPAAGPSRAESDGTRPAALGLELQMCAVRSVRYKVIHAPAFDISASTLADLVQGRRALLVLDRNVNALYGGMIAGYAEQRLKLAHTVVIDGDERAKNWAQVERICAEAHSAELERNGFIVCAGGGVALDIAGFAASIYRRGVPYIRIATTLTGLVDVSVGVKHGVNLGSGKNLIGSFYAPVASINDSTFLRTLPDVYLASGVAEILKIAIVRDEVLFGLVERHVTDLMASRFQHPHAVAEEVLWRAEKATLDELEDNLFESNLQRYLDFGHSFSPKLESASNFVLPHGFAVGLDMLLSAHIATARGLCDSFVLDRMLRVYDAVGLPTSQSICSADQLAFGLQSVAAHRAGDLNLVLPTGIGSTIFSQHVEQEEISAALTYFADRRMTVASAGF